MPYKIGKHADCSGFAVMKKADGKLMGCHSTEAKAKKQMAALHAKEPTMAKALAEVQSVKTFWRASDYGLDLERSAKGNPVLTGELLRFNEWNEIDSPIEGNFMERFLPSVFKKTFAERMSKLRVLFQHGRDPSIGDKPLGRIRDMPNDGIVQRYEVELFGVSYVDDLLPALEGGQFGSSFSARDINSEVKTRVKRSDTNPAGLDEVTRKELAMREFGPVTFPAIESATAHVRSITDEHLHPGVVELFKTLGIELPQLTRAETLEAEDEPEPEDEPETTPPDDEPPHSEEEADKSREEEPPSWQLRR